MLEHNLSEWRELGLNIYILVQEFFVQWFISWFWCLIYKDWWLWSRYIYICVYTEATMDLCIQVLFLKGKCIYMYLYVYLFILPKCIIPYPLLKNTDVENGLAVDHVSLPGPRYLHPHHRWPDHHPWLPPCVAIGYGRYQGTAPMVAVVVSQVFAWNGMVVKQQEHCRWWRMMMAMVGWYEGGNGGGVGWGWRWGWWVGVMGAGWGTGKHH